MSQNQLSTQKASDLRKLITGDNMKKQFEAALPKHLSPDRFCRIAITALTKTPKLVDCTQESLFACLLTLSSFGLEPDGRRAHLIPYGNQCTLIIDWKGLAELAMRSGVIAKLHADIVCENDTFTYSMGEVTEHGINFKQPRGEMYAAYAMAQTKTGEKFFCVMSKEEIEAIRKRSRSGSNGPWVTDFSEMAKKSAFRRLSKWLPLSAEFRDATEKDDEANEIDVTPQKALSFDVSPPLEGPASTEYTPSTLDEFVIFLGDKDMQVGVALERICKLTKNNYPDLKSVPDSVLADVMNDWDSFAA